MLAVLICMVLFLAYMFVSGKVGVINFIKFTFTFVFMIGFAYAQDTVPAPLPVEALPPEWLGGILLWLQSVPTVGPILVEVLKWTSVIVTIFTVLSTSVMALLKVPEIAARISGAEKIADKIKAFSDKIMPWLKYVSAYNVQKK